MVVLTHLLHELQEGDVLDHSLSWLFDLTETLGHDLLDEVGAHPQNRLEAFFECLPIEYLGLPVALKQRAVGTEQVIDFVAAYRSFLLEVSDVPFYERVLRIERTAILGHLLQQGL